MKHLRRLLPEAAVSTINTNLGRYLGVLLLFSSLIGAVLALVYFQITLDSYINGDGLKSALWTVYFVLTIIAGIGAWLLVLAQESRRVAEEEPLARPDLLMQELKLTNAPTKSCNAPKKSPKPPAKPKAVISVGLSHELRTPLNSILGYARFSSGIPVFHRSEPPQ